MGLNWREGGRGFAQGISQLAQMLMQQRMEQERRQEYEDFAREMQDDRQGWQASFANQQTMDNRGERLRQEARQERLDPMVDPSAMGGLVNAFGGDADQWGAALPRTPMRQSAFAEEESRARLQAQRDAAALERARISSEALAERLFAGYGFRADVAKEKDRTTRARDMAGNTGKVDVKRDVETGVDSRFYDPQDFGMELPDAGRALAAGLLQDIGTAGVDSFRTNPALSEKQALAAAFDARLPDIEEYEMGAGEAMSALRAINAKVDDKARDLVIQRGWGWTDPDIDYSAAWKQIDKIGSNLLFSDIERIVRDVWPKIPKDQIANAVRILNKNRPEPDPFGKD